MLISRCTLLVAVGASLLAAGSAMADDLAAGVAAKLRESGTLSGYRVNVKAKDGTVWLSGTVADDRQLQAAVGVAESIPGVERVVNRLTIAAADAGTGSSTQSSREGSPDRLSLPASIKSMMGMAAGPAAPTESRAKAESPAGLIQLVQATAPSDQNRPQRPQADRGRAPRQQAARSPRPIAASAARPMPMRSPAGRSGVQQVARTNAMGEPMMLPSPSDYSAMPEGLVDGQMVPGSMRMNEGGAVMHEGAMAGEGMPVGSGMGRPMPMGGAGVGMPPVPVRGDGPNMPNYAWPSYAASPNYAALQYPTQYSPTAWPYIGPFYPYPQVPLGWRRVSLEWDDGWWFLDFDDRHHHSHHR